MLSTISPQRTVVPVNTGQLGTPPVFNEKQPIIEAAIPVQLRELLKKCYGLEEGADLYAIPNNPNKLVSFFLSSLTFLFFVLSLLVFLVLAVIFGLLWVEV